MRRGFSMNGDDHLRSLKKFSAITLVLMLGLVFHTLCWSSLFKRNGVIERPVAGLNCPCIIDQRFEMTKASTAGSQKSCTPDAQETLVSTH